MHLWNDLKGEEKTITISRIFATLVLKERRHLSLVGVFFLASLANLYSFRVSTITHNASETCDLLLALKCSAALCARCQLELVAEFPR